MLDALTAIDDDGIATNVGDEDIEMQDAWSEEENEKKDDEKKNDDKKNGEKEEEERKEAERREEEHRRRRELMESLVTQSAAQAAASASAAEAARQDAARAAQAERDRTIAILNSLAAAAEHRIVSQRSYYFEARSRETNQAFWAEYNTAFMYCDRTLGHIVNWRTSALMEVGSTPLTALMVRLSAIENDPMPPIVAPTLPSTWRLYLIGRDCGGAKTINRHTLLDDTESFVPDEKDTTSDWVARREVFRDRSRWSRAMVASSKHNIGPSSRRRHLSRLIPMVKGERC